MSGLLSGFDEAVCQREYCSIIFNLQRAVLTAEIRVSILLIVLRLAEKRQHILKAPSATAHLRPTVEVGRVAAHIKHAIYRTRSAECLASLPVNAAAGASRRAFSAIIPVHDWMVQQFEHASGYVDPG